MNGKPKIRQRSTLMISSRQSIIFIVAAASYTMIGCQTSPAPILVSTPVEEPQAIEGPWRICIDPGHGGPWSGAVSHHNGLRECDVNLAVSLRLAELLEAEGHIVSLTRTTDTALDTTSLSADLRARAAFANKQNADLFLSVHHNADIVEGSVKDDLEMYYAGRDPYASLRLGETLTHQLAKGYRSRAPGKLLLPGNYSVLRNTAMTAVLTETAYLTHKESAQLLATPEGAEAEAQDLFRGITDFLNDAPPIRATGVAFDREDGRTQINLNPHTARKVRAVNVDGLMVEFADNVENHQNIVLPYRLPNGPHTIETIFVNESGHTHALTIAHRVQRPARNIAINTNPTNSEFRSGAVAEVHVHLTDCYGFPVPNVAVNVDSGGAVQTAADGIAVIHYRVGSASQRIHAQASGLRQRAELPRSTATGARTVAVLNALTGQPIANAIMESENDHAVSSASGWAAVNGTRVQVSAIGYIADERTLRSPHTEILLTPVANADLHDKIIVLDPIDGGRNAGSIGPTGLRASDVTWDVAQRTAAALRSLGAHVAIPRGPEDEIGELTRIRWAEESNPNLYIAIAFGIDEARARLMDDEGHRIAPPKSFAAHYPGSTNGAKFARIAAKSLSLESVPASVYYPVQQMSCPAVLVQPAPVEIGEEALRHAHIRSRIASGLAEAIIEYFRPSDE